MINFMNDYNSPAHPAIIRAVSDSAGNKYPGYGDDEITGQARMKIKSLLGPDNDADVHFLAGGTQTNLTAVCAFLRPHEAVVAAGSSHIQLHETGAIEATGHRILLTDSHTDAVTHYLRHDPAAPYATGGGKLTAGDVRRICGQHGGEHMVKPRLVYISQSTELGGIYSASEICDLRGVCDEYGLLLYMDGARLGAALAAPGNDAGLVEIAALCDAFYIGGTKNGLLFGEALVIMNSALKADFRFIQKQRGCLLAKGFLLGIQFNALFDKGLFFEIAKHAGTMAEKLRIGLERLGCRFFVNSATNQIFPVLHTSVIRKLEESFLFEIWETVDDNNAAIRFVTSWNTTAEEVDALLTAINDAICPGI
jgi:threonine aldolase